MRDSPEIKKARKVLTVVAAVLGLLFVVVTVRFGGGFSVVLFGLLVVSLVFRLSISRASLAKAEANRARKAEERIRSGGGRVDVQQEPLANRLAVALGTLVGVAGGGLVAGLLVKYVAGMKDEHAIAVGCGTAALLLLIVVLIIQGSRTKLLAKKTEQQAARQKEADDRYSQAVKQLGDAQLELRVAGIHVLGQIAQEHPSHREGIRGVLTSFLTRVKAQGAEGTPASPAELEAAQTVLSKVNEWIRISRV